MVDTYGLLDPEKLRHYFSILNRYVDGSVCIGYHAHNNFQLGFANVMSMVEYVPEDESENAVLKGHYSEWEKAPEMRRLN